MVLSFDSEDKSEQFTINQTADPLKSMIFEEWYYIKILSLFSYWHYLKPNGVNRIAYGGSL